MSRKRPAEEEAAPFAYLLKPAKDLCENFSIDLLTYLNRYLDEIRRDDGDDNQTHEPQENYKLFNFAGACIVLQGSANVYAKKVDYIYDVTDGLLNIIEHGVSDEAAAGAARKGGRRRKADLGPTSYDLFDWEKISNDINANMEKVEKEEKKLIDSLRLIDNAELAEAENERRSVQVIKPAQFNFGREFDQLMRTEEQVLNAKPRKEVIGRVRDFHIKKSEILHDHQTLIIDDTYKKNIDDFTLPGARWIPDNKELAAHFGVADVEVELDMEKTSEKVNVFGPFKDPLSGREIVAPPRWYIEKEAVKQQQEQSRAASAARSNCGQTVRDSQGYGSQPTRLSQPMIEKRRELNGFISFVEGRINKTRASTHLNTGLVDMLVENHGNNIGNDMYDGGNDGGDYDGGMDYENDEDDKENEYVDDIKRKKERKRLAPWDDLTEMSMNGLLYTGNEDISVSNKKITISEKDPISSVDFLAKKKKKEAKQGVSRRDDFMQTHDYLENYYYWRSAARINPNNDWKIQALRTTILKEQKRKAKERIQVIRDARARKEVEKAKNRRGKLSEMEFDQCVEWNLTRNEENDVMRTGNDNRRTLGAEYDDVVDDDLAAEVEISMLGGAYDDDDEVLPRGETSVAYPNIDVPEPFTNITMPNPQEMRTGLRFDAIDDAELADVANLPGHLFIDRALPLLKKFAENRTDREQMAYEMAKAYEEIDIEGSIQQAKVDEWHTMLEPRLDEGETRKEYDVHTYGNAMLDNFSSEGETKSLTELMVGKPWYEISRYFLSCLLMSNTKNVKVTTDVDIDVLEQINTMKISLISKKKHHEVFAQDGAL